MVALSWYWRMTLFVLIAGARVLNGQEFPPSPCPKLFYYYTDNQTSQIRGALHIPPTDSIKISVSVEFIVALNLNTVRG
jgi:hypothetical protein